MLAYRVAAFACATWKPKSGSYVCSFSCWLFLFFLLLVCLGFSLNSCCFVFLLRCFSSAWHLPVAHNSMNNWVLRFWSVCSANPDLHRAYNRVLLPSINSGASAQNRQCETKKGLYPWLIRQATRTGILNSEYVCLLYSLQQFYFPAWIACSQLVEQYHQSLCYYSCFPLGRVMWVCCL